MMFSQHADPCRVLLIAVVCCAAPPNAFAEDKVLLKPPFEPGRTVYIESSWDAQYVWSGPDYPEEGVRQSLRQIEGLLCRTESVSPDGTASVTFTFDRLALAGGEGDETLEFDSDSREPDDPANQYARVFRPMLGMSFTAQIEKGRTVASVRGMAAIRERIEAIGKDDPFPTGLTGEYLTDPYRKAELERLLVFHPHEVVGVGDEWEGEFHYRSAVKRCRFKAERLDERVDGRLLVAQYTLELRQDKPESFDRGTWLTVVESQQGQGKGRAVFDAVRGGLLEVTEELEKSLCVRMQEKGAAESTRLRGTKNTKERMRLLSLEERRTEQRAKRRQGK
jgi:hypothetical protein